MSERTYHLSPPDRTGWILGLSGPQCLTLGAAIVIGVTLARLGAPLVVVPLVLAGASVLALVPAGGGPLIESVVPGWRWLRGGGRRERTWFAPLVPMNPAEAVTTPVLPPPLDDQVLLAVDVPGGIAGVVHDRRGATYAASLRVSGPQFALVERAEQDALLGLWGDALAAFSRDDTPVAEVRWSEWAAPAGMEEQYAYLAEHGITDADDPAVASYRQLLRSAGPVATRHEVLVTVVVSAAKVKAPSAVETDEASSDGAGSEALRSEVAGAERARAERARAERARAATGVLFEELRLLKARLEAAGLGVSAPLSVPELCRALRVRLDPSCIAVLDRRGRSLGDRAGLVSPADRGPLATSLSWTRWRVDGSLHRSFYFREWPRFELGPAWMANLLLYGASVRTIAMCYRPVPPRVSQRAILRQAAKLESDVEQRRRTGFRVGAHHRRAARAVEEREEELVAGFAELEYVGLLDVCAPDETTLARSCAELVGVSAGCAVELRPLNGRHDAAVAACLPLARGLAPRTVNL